MQPLYAWSQFFFYFVLSVEGVEVRRKFQYRKTDGTVIITCLAVQARSPRPHTHGLVTRPWTNVIRFTRRAEAHFPPLSDSCVRQTSLPQITQKKNSSCLHTKKGTSFSFVFVFVGCVPYETEHLSIRQKWSHLFQITRSTAMSTIFRFYEYCLCSSLLVCLNLNSAA
jgi:hypothetical protein